MKLLANERIKALFVGILLCALGFMLISALLIGLHVPHAALYIALCGLFMGGGVALLCCRYLQAQHRLMENAITQMRVYLSGDRDVRIPCDDEGEVYRLFHEVNALVAILNAHAEKEKSDKEFMQRTLSDISHQLKTPLAALNIYHGIMQQEAALSPTFQTFLPLCEQELDRMETLVQNLLKIVRFDAGTMVLERSPQNVSALMERVKKQYAYRTQQEGKALTLSGDENTVLFCDGTWITEAVSNLVKNALDHTTAGHTVSIAWHAFPSMVQIMVTDNGSGISPQDLPHIFKRFYRSRFSQNKQGIGLGLPLCKAVVDAHNGAIEVDSQPGTGATFTLSFLIPTKL